MKCPNCGCNNYELGIACVSCGYREEPREVESEAIDFAKVGAKNEAADNKMYSLCISGVELEILQEAICDAASYKLSPELDVIADRIGLLMEARMNNGATKCTKCGYVHHMKDGNCPACKTVVNKK